MYYDEIKSLKTAIEESQSIYIRPTNLQENSLTSICISFIYSLYFCGNKEVVKQIKDLYMLFLIQGVKNSLSVKKRFCKYRCKTKLSFSYQLKGVCISKN